MFPGTKVSLLAKNRLFKLKEIWTILICLRIANYLRDLALFKLAIDSKLRGCDLVSFRY